MAVTDQVFELGDDAVIKVSALATVTSSAELSLGINKLYAINATQDIHIKKGMTGMGAASAADFRIPANQIVTFFSGNYTHIRVFNSSGSNADVYITSLGR